MFSFVFKWTGQLNPAFLPPTPKGKLTETGSPTSKLILGDLGPVFSPPLTCPQEGEGVLSTSSTLGAVGNVPGLSQNLDIENFKVWHFCYSQVCQSDLDFGCPKCSKTEVA